ncbi:lipoprotein-releasing ABC transporter permease subunit [Thioalkalivibrio sp. XN8]|uniref:lipoprotein-releasing ABC transporter permease subunit n=1 Tax=Thioalkalivibrio sp. XN8 TaxID=2712863 RepID=UPI0013EBA33A|nr:lipoprotein-releasing ABC transporter permease subunit [Thioalkalivibrio sp. XN8]NGP52796.1 lipoprotein-releasing ABC transporter permease subunit [Thioalkalivibrio sp. XN8]
MSRRWRWLVGTRYLRARTHNRFVSFISAISILGVAVGVAVLIVVLSVMNGFETELRTRILALAAHAQLEGFGRGIADWPAVAAQVEADPEVSAAAPYIQGEGMLLRDEQVSGVMVRGILPATEARVSALPAIITEGSLEALTPGGWNILLGSALARELGVGVGDKVVLAIAQGTVTPAGLVPRLRRFTVAGIFSAGMYDFDRGLAYVHLDDAARLWRLGENVTGLRLDLPDMFRAPEVARRLATELGGGYYVSDWTRQHVNFFRSIQLSKQMMFTILLLVVAVAAFNIVSTLVMVVQDKQGDIAILRTLGASPPEIMSVFMIQGTLIGLVGTLAGLGLGALLALNIEQLVHLLEAAVGTTFLAADVYFMSDLPAELRAGDLWRICGTAFVLTVLSTIYPAWRAARSQPAEALRHE